MSKPLFIMVGGCNGAGKSTLGQVVVREHYQVADYLNADLIAAGLKGMSERERNIAAGKLMLHLMHDHFAAGRSFAVESTLTSQSARKWILHAKEIGYRAILIYYYLNSPQLAVERVEKRVQRGGHDIPTDVIYRRYDESLRQLRNFYLDAVEDFMLFDNSCEPLLIGSRINAIIYRTDEKLYAQITQKG